MVSLSGADSGVFYVFFGVLLYGKSYVFSRRFSFLLFLVAVGFPSKGALVVVCFWSGGWVSKRSLLGNAFLAKTMHFAIELVCLGF